MASQIKHAKGQQDDHERTRHQGDSLSLHHQIEVRAHEIWLSTGAGHGNDVAHWIQAESEVLAAHQKRQPQA
jgi:hypothetical protein